MDPEEWGWPLIITLNKDRQDRSFRQRKQHAAVGKAQAACQESQGITRPADIGVLDTYLLKDDNEINPARSRFPS